MKKVIKSEVLKDIDKLLGTKGKRQPGKPLADEMFEKTKKNKVA